MCTKYALIPYSFLVVHQQSHYIKAVLAGVSSTQLIVNISLFFAKKKRNIKEIFCNFLMKKNGLKSCS